VNSYRVTTHANPVSPHIWNVAAQYWEYDSEFLVFYADPATPTAKAPREVVFAVPLALNPVIAKVAA